MKIKKIAAAFLASALLGTLSMEALMPMRAATNPNGAPTTKWVL
jgi:hypothetical protein